MPADPQEPAVAAYPDLDLAPVVLEGDVVRLEPLSLDHLGSLVAVGLDPAIWQWMRAAIRSPADMRSWVTEALEAARAGVQLPFALVDRASRRAVGSTRYLNVAPADRRLEIGHTWVAPPWQRTALNTEAKLLLLEHAFERLGCNRVEFKTDSLNERSRSALLRIGAVEEGTLREHMVAQGGRLRHSVYFSILRSEWPGAKAALRRRLARTAQP